MTPNQDQDPDADPWYAQPDEWENYGDVHPRRHGGRFVRWENGMWHVIETRHPDDLPAGMVDGEHLVDHQWVEPHDVFVDGDPEQGFTDHMKSVLESLDATHLDPDTYPDEPDGEYAPEFHDRVAYYVVDLTQYVGDHRDEYPDDADYWDHLAEYGIDPEEMDGVLLDD